MFIFVITFLVILIIWVALQEKHYWDLYKEFNGDTPLPIIGNALKFGRKSETILKNIFEMWERNGKTTFRFKLASAPYIFICEPEHVEVLLKSAKEINKADDYKFFKSWLGDGLLLSTGQKWQHQRKTITPTFHFKILEQFGSIFNRCGDIMIDNLSQSLNTVVDIYPFVTLCALDIICETAMGTNVNAQKNSNSEYVQAIYKVSRLAHHRTFSLLKRFDCIYRFTPDYYTEKKTVKVIHDMSSSVIKTRQQQLKNIINEVMMQKEEVPVSEDQFKIKGKTAFLDLLLLSKTNEGMPLSDEVIKDEVNTFMFEGHDTTSSCIAFSMHCLANNAEVQKLAFEEQYAIFGNDLTREVTMSDMYNMNYLEKVIKETLRLYPSVPFFGRTLKEDLLLHDGKIIPAGTRTGISPILLGRNPRIYNNPEIFDPERFAQENSLSKNPFLYIPFSAGPRNCIGQKFAMLDIKILLSKVLRNYQLISAGKEYNVILAAELILKSTNGMQLVLKKRIY